MIIAGCQRIPRLSRLPAASFCCSRRFIIIISLHTCRYRVVASLDSRSLPAPTVRHSQCELIVSRDSPQCTSCADYRHTLRTMSSRQVSSVVQAKRVAINLESHQLPIFVDTREAPENEEPAS